ncbi:protein CUSTOS isoform X1 [Lates calcarifer]|uniref:Protein CUSTOS n=1 Tax=Lates calcarifer TaxID=8187 RepID=A0AAJ7LIE7_LATCA|nr:protein CUSTOS isoform X1 [Lates calcarifer]
MAASVKKMVGVSDDSSSSDDETLKRCQEAVWETRPEKKKDGDSNVKQSKRVVVADHEHDGNELQVSKGFRTHVAKKLGHFLDSCIAEMQTETSSCVESAQCDDGDDEGFRLFSTSVPGQTAEEPPTPVRRRPVPSSSDSDSEMEARLKEAAVSVKDLLPSSTPPSTLSPPSTEPPCSEKIKKKKKKKMAEGEESHVVKKKKKRKQNQEESAQVDCVSSHLIAQNNSETGNSEQEHTQVKVKQKKKKKREGNTGEEALN